jgi:ATP-dependent DNA ligase
MRSTCSPCLPISGKAVSSTPAWFHEEVKYDGYRLIVTREGDRVRLLTRNGRDWNSRFPWIVESALRNRYLQLSMRMTNLATIAPAGRRIG